VGETDKEEKIDKLRAIKISNARIFMTLNFAHAIKPCQLQIIIIRKDMPVKKIHFLSTVDECNRVRFLL